MLWLLMSLFPHENLKAQNAIVTENQKTGNPASEWDISGAGDLSIQGFATDISVNKGGTVHFKIKTDASAYTINIYRLGYYQGNGARKIGTAAITARLPQSQPAPKTDNSTGLIDCGNWSESANWVVPTTAVSGLYIAKLSRSDTKGSSHIVFIVRDDASTSSLYFKTSDATWQAYNGYGGNSLYTGNTSYPNGHAAKVSYNRPFYTRDGGGGGGVAEDWLFNAEYPMIRWLERNGYDMTYITDVDADRRGNLIKNHRVFLSVGHDEYWSGQERANVEAARAAGNHLAFFSSNEIYWKTRWEASIDGTNTAYRTLVCYKEGTLGENSCGGKCDPLSNVWTGLWRDGCNYPTADGCRPENALSGQISWYESDNAITVPSTYKGYRFWRNTSIATTSSGTTTLSNGTIGYEWDYEQNNGSYPAGRVRMSQTTISGHTHQLSLYRHSSGALVFGAGTGQWSWGLDGKHDRSNLGSTPDVRIQQATANLFADMGVQPGSLQTGLVAPTATNDLQAPVTVISSPKNGATITPNVAVTISGTATEAAGVVAGVEVSVNGGTTWVSANGTTSWSYTWTPTAKGTYTIKSRAVDDMGNLETTATSSNTIQVSTNTSNCTPPTATLSATPANCNSITLKLSAATGLAPYTVIVNNQTYSNVNVSQNFATVSTEQSIWGNSGTPQTPNDNDGQSIEVGVKFQASQTGTITGIRFYKGSGNTGTHTGSLWSSSGTKLASATFTNETASGWQEVRFATPVSISANTTYVASYYSTGGVYSSSENFFAADVSNGSLKALQDGRDGPNGIYKLGTSGFPNSSFNSSNYWVDVLFKPGSSYTFNLTSITDANGCNNTGNISTATVTQSQLPSCSTTTYYQDSDNDGYGNPLVTKTGTTPPAGYVSNNTDCDDNNAAIHPGAAEVCGNNIDDNCNGSVDEGCSVVTEQSIWGSSGSPQNPNDNDGQSIEVGVKFRASQNGTITGIRFYKGTNNTGTHTGNLWSSGGTKLATATFTNETAIGWQEVRFATPVSISLNTTYVASYYSASGTYASTEGFFANGSVTNGSLTALRSGTDGANGVYRLGSTGFPTSSYNSSNYWVDVLFKPATSAARVPISQEDPKGQKLAVKVMPNPAASYFTLLIKGSDKGSIKVRVTDASGRIVENKGDVRANDTFTIGEKYRPGTYYVQLIQSNEKVMIKLVKLSK
ncbi:DUF4082 domain-containing protein [Segetibacter koreensis]|uniref:DUF4082 domain-containing protein n=1 Tax=Segetibacter koreensis TaxID=398037 RepID=UPI0003A574CF|nr:DUF4082 domain-containing protein [Segetibacter koreensis]